MQTMERQLEQQAEQLRQLLAEKADLEAHNALLQQAAAPQPGGEQLQPPPHQEGGEQQQQQADPENSSSNNEVSLLVMLDLLTICLQLAARKCQGSEKMSAGHGALRQAAHM